MSDKNKRVIGGEPRNSSSENALVLVDASLAQRYGDQVFVEADGEKTEGGTTSAVLNINGHRLLIEITDLAN